MSKILNQYKSENKRTLYLISLEPVNSTLHAPHDVFMKLSPH